MSRSRRYLTLAADYLEVSLRDEATGRLELGDLALPRDLVEDLVAWNERYQAVIPMDLDERQAEVTSALIEELDGAGQALASRVAQVLADDSKVKYYSEGRLQLLL